jgi:organic hydroperoxide reductase OsmC/OhrA
MEKKHQYSLTIKWTGNKGQGTSRYNSYERSHTIVSGNKEKILCSSDPVFRGDKSKYNPEELFVASISSCHMLWYLHLCADEGIIVTDYVDNAVGTLLENPDGSGHFTDVTLFPVVTVKDKSMINKANELHKRAHEFCFIASSCRFEIHHKPACRAEEELNLTSQSK